MGNEEEVGEEEVDFLSLLPAELVLRVALCLPPADVTRCLLVCREWRARLANLQPYWRVACTTAVGLSGSMVLKLAPRYSTHRGLFLAAMSYLRHFAAPPPSTSPLTQGLPFNTRYSPQFAELGCIVGTLYDDFQPREMVVERVRGPTITRTHTLKLVSTSRAEHRVLWGSIVNGDSYICATASGRWSVYDISSPPSLRPLPPQMTWVGDPLYDPDLRLACCKRCGLVAMVKLISFHTVDEQSFWEVRFLRLQLGMAPPSHLLRFRIYHKNRDIVGRRVPHGKRWAWLIPKTPPTSPDKACSAHFLLLQWSNSITSHVFSASGVGLSLLSPSPHLSLLAPCDSLDSALYDRTGLNTEMALSADSELVGVVFQARLHVWEVWNGGQLSCVDLPDTARFEQLRLLAVGHLLTLVGLQFTTELLLLLTLSGGVVKRIRGFAEQYSHLASPYSELLCVDEEEWLSDISTHGPAQQQSIVFWNKTNRSLEAVLLGEEPVANGNQTLINSSKRKSRWKFWK